MSEALAEADPKIVKEQITQFASPDALQILAASQIRDELVFPTPVVLQIKPTLVGYYRLLSGIPQKSFYAATTGMTPFKAMEVSGVLKDSLKPMLPNFCKEMGRALSELVREISPRFSTQDVRELPLLTLGAQFQGANNTRIGQQAAKDVFLAIAKVVEGSIVERTQTKLLLRNASGARVIITLAGDPDVRVQLKQRNGLQNKLAIEIKGGSDKSNAHNRAGEAEKSHRQAREHDFRECWTLIYKKGLKESKLKQESPTTDQWFDVAEVLAEEGADWEEFRTRLADIAGVRARGRRSRLRSGSIADMSS